MLQCFIYVPEGLHVSLNKNFHLLLTKKKKLGCPPNTGKDIIIKRCSLKERKIHEPKEEKLKE